MKVKVLKGKHLTRFKSQSLLFVQSISSDVPTVAMQNNSLRKVSREVDR